jgi:MotA/TolQ/ExbB proton channel family
VAIVSPRLQRNGRSIADAIRFESGTEPAPLESDVDPPPARSKPAAGPQQPAAAAGRAEAPAAFLSRFVVLQAVGAAGVVALWIAGLAGMPFEGANGPLCWIIVAIGAVGLLCTVLRRWQDVQWVATHVVRIGLLGTVVGLIIAFSAARHGGSADVEAVKGMITSVVDGMYVSLYATLLGIAVNLWLKINLRLLGNVHG